MSTKRDATGPSGESGLYTLEVSVRITRKPKSTIRLYRGNTAVQEEILTEGFLMAPDGGDHYPVRFVHNRTLGDARVLRPGDVIRVTQGRLRKYPGRKEIELHVKRFHLYRTLPPV